MGGKSSSSSSRSRSRSSSSSSSRSGKGPAFVIDDLVEVHGLESETGRQLNGRIGTVLQYIEATGRFEVKFGPEQVALLRPDKLRRAKQSKQKGEADAEKAPPPPNTAEKPKPLSLASLLGMGRPAEKEKPKEPVYQSVWARNAGEETARSAPPAAALDEEAQEALRTMMSNEEGRARELEEVRARVVAEFAQVGVVDEIMIEEAFQQQLKEHDLQKTLRPDTYAQQGSQAAAATSGRRGGSSRSTSSSSSRKSRSRSRSRSPSTKPKVK